MKYSYKFLKLGLQFAVFSAVFGALSAQGAVLFSHSGGTDPTTEGWSQGGHNSTGLSTGSTTVGGVPAWAISDSSVSPTDGNIHDRYYVRTIASDDFLSGWSLRTSMQVAGTVSAGNPTNIAYVTHYQTDGTVVTGNSLAYEVLFGAASGKTTVALFGYNSNQILYTAPDANLINVELKYNPGGTAVSLYINGSQIVNDYQGSSAGANLSSRVWWGKTSTTASARTSNWASVEFQYIPEPSSMAFLTISAGMMAAFAAIRRKRLV